MKKFLLVSVLLIGLVVITWSQLVSRKHSKETLLPSNLTESIISKLQGVPGDDWGKWVTYRNEKYHFEFKHPPNYELGPLILEKTRRGDSILLFKRRDGRLVQSIHVYLPPEKFDLSANALARNLDDYRSNYKVENGDVLIHGQEETVINGVKVLRQLYSFGHWVEGVDSKSFSTSNEFEENHWPRYIFFDEKYGFIILKSYPGSNNRADSFLDSVAGTFRFIK